MGSSYLYAEQAFIGKTKACQVCAYRQATGWASHLYYWVYPGCMVGVTAILRLSLESVFLLIPSAQLWSARRS